MAIYDIESLHNSSLPWLVAIIQLVLPCHNPLGIIEGRVGGPYVQGVEVVVDNFSFLSKENKCLNIKPVQKALQTTFFFTKI